MLSEHSITQRVPPQNFDGTSRRARLSIVTPRYRLNLFNDADVLDDDEGYELADLAEAKEKAISGARGLISEHVRLGRPINLDHRMEIADDGKVLAIIPFRELVTIVDGES